MWRRRLPKNSDRFSFIPTKKSWTLQRWYEGVSGKHKILAAVDVDALEPVSSNRFMIDKTS